ncbi:MAG: hypothetical protein K2M60_12310 [Lachnospiraceae bacterium]|nr:hypothetical protein [Lachnospiraceae bacterium]MDE6251153.1 hypothetical protein [Lachnospiraceae bacterium]
MDRLGDQMLSGMDINIPVAAESIINEATIVAINKDGYAVPASKTTGQIVAGCAIKYTDNALGGNGDIEVPVRRGTFVWNNDGSIKKTDILKDAYVSDSQTVTITATGSSKVGKILAVDDDGITVEML